MAASVLSAPHFHDEQAAFDYVEAKLWPNGPTCPHCGNADAKRICKMVGKTTRLGLRKCNECRKPFTVRQGTIFESSHLPLNLWLQIIHLMCASKKGISTRQIQRMLVCSMKTAWFLTHRIREAMRSGDLSPMGGSGQTVEADETYIGRKLGEKVRAGGHHKNAVLTLVERGGRARSFHIERAAIGNIAPIVRENIAKESGLMTDESTLYSRVGREFASHDTIDHGRDEYGYTDRVSGFNANTNTIEGYFSIFKRGMVGVYQHCGEQHLHAISPSSTFATATA